MHDEPPPRGSINLQLFGIPISIHPFSWVMLAILGGGLHISRKEDISGVLLFVVAGMLCLLVHELGHALTGRWLTGSRPSVVIAGLGGVTYTPRPPRTRAGYFAYIFAGPFSSLLLGLAAGAIFGLQIGNILAGIEISVISPLTPLGIEPSLELQWAIGMGLYETAMPPTLQEFYSCLFMVSVWWTIFNLLPIFPLDGGKLLATLLNNERIACIIGLIFGSALSILFILLALNGWGSMWNVFITGYLTYINYSILRSMR